ncbi:MAG: polymer-forming cytoskeletal protein [Actinomycetota bacterium]|jgi:cytoskeletal protein CcmA (bactofilin family)|nr:polymer-forming cytoskeletal protein [Actinomycetota bacterium]
MFGIKTTKDKNNHNIIASGTNIEGTIYSPSSIKIDGSVTGEIISRKELTIGKEGKIRASIKTKKMIIEGSVVGNIISIGEVKITSSGKMAGNIIQKNTSLIIDDEGSFKGNSILINDRKIFKIKDTEKISNIKIVPEKILRY